MSDRNGPFIYSGVQAIPVPRKEGIQERIIRGGGALAPLSSQEALTKRLNLLAKRLLSATDPLEKQQEMAVEAERIQTLLNSTGSNQEEREAAILKQRRGLSNTVRQEGQRGKDKEKVSTLINIYEALQEQRKELATSKGQNKAELAKIESGLNQVVQAIDQAGLSPANIKQIEQMNESLRLSLVTALQNLRAGETVSPQVTPGGFGGDTPQGLTPTLVPTFDPSPTPTPASRRAKIPTRSRVSPENQKIIDDLETALKDNVLTEEERQQVQAQIDGLRGLGNPSQGKGLWDREIEAFMGSFNLPGWKGVIMLDQIEDTDLNPRAKFNSWITNTLRSDSKEREGHWVALLYSRDDASYEIYDPLAELGLDDSKETNDLLGQIKSLIKSKRLPSLVKIKANGVRSQSQTSDTCGFFAMKFILDRVKGGKSFKEASRYQSAVKRGEGEIKKFKAELYA